VVAHLLSFPCLSLAFALGLAGFFEFGGSLLAGICLNSLWLKAGFAELVLVGINLAGVADTATSGPGQFRLDRRV
jgi:hypothetical protein